MRTRGLFPLLLVCCTPTDGESRPQGGDRSQVGLRANWRFEPATTAIEFDEAAPPFLLSKPLEAKNYKGGRIAAGNLRAREEFLDEVQGAVEQGDGLGDFWAVDRVLAPLHTAVTEWWYCPWIERTLLDERRPLVVRQMLWPEIGWCTQNRYRKLAEHPSAPNEAVVAWFSGVPFMPPVEKEAPAYVLSAVDGLLEQEGGANSTTLTRVSITLAHFGRGDIRAQLDRMEAAEARWGSEPNPGLSVARAIRTRRDPWAVERVRKICERFDPVPDLPGCTPASFWSFIDASWSFEYETYVETMSEAQVVSELEGCVSDKSKEPSSRRRCLGRLAARDRPAARRLAQQLPGIPWNWHSFLDAHATAESGEAELRGRGLISTDSVPHGDGAALSAFDVMLQHGRATLYSRESDWDTTGIDAALHRILVLADPSFEDVLVHSPMPEEIGKDVPVEVYFDGKRGRARVGFGERFATLDVVGLANSIFELRGSSLRAMALPRVPWLEGVPVVVGDPKVLEAAVQDGLLEPGP